MTSSGCPRPLQHQGGAAGCLTLPFSSPPTSCLLVPPATSQVTIIALLKTGGNNRQLLSLSEQGGRSAHEEPWASNSGFPETPVGASEILKNSKFSRHIKLLLQLPT